MTAHTAQSATGEEGLCDVSPGSYALCWRGADRPPEDRRTRPRSAVTEIPLEAGSTGVQTDTAITVIFNRPVVPLVVAEDLPDLPQPLAFEPRSRGRASG
jgi:hypothetical protein